MNMRLKRKGVCTRVVRRVVKMEETEEMSREGGRSPVTRGVIMGRTGKKSGGNLVVDCYPAGTLC